jgi:hypothetical protein
MSLARAMAYACLLPKLGPGNVWSVLRYRQRLARGAFVQLLPAQSIRNPEPLWMGTANTKAAPCVPALAEAITRRGDAICQGKFTQFGEKLSDEGEYPAWFKGVYAASATQHFSRAGINAIAGEDVKITWDLSRFHWATDLAIAAAISSGDMQACYLARLNQLTTHWLTHNGYNHGINWACAHEVSVRSMQIMLASIVLGTHVGLKPSPQLLALMQQSWHRVHVAQAYGRAQQNNHSLAEHLFLVYAAAFLAQHGVQVAPQKTLKKLQRHVPKLMQSLVLDDGGCNMYSTNYHRVFCDIVSFAKIFDDALQVGIFAQPLLKQKVAAIAHFLAAMIDPISGHAPLIGHNDGSLHCLQFCGFADYRPSLLLLCSVAGLPVPAFASPAKDTTWLFGYVPHILPAPETLPAEKSFDHFGLLVITMPAYRAYVKYPRNRFRPAQEDFLHLDLWVDGKNLLTDSGTYSYNAPTPDRADGMSEPAAHNVPLMLNGHFISKFSPFLYRYWPNAGIKKTGEGAYAFSVSNGAGVTLKRSIAFGSNQIRLSDSVSGGPAWAVSFNGVIEMDDDGMGAILGSYATMQFGNAKNLCVVDGVRADYYLSRVANDRLRVVPENVAQALISTITITASE